MEYDAVHRPSHYAEGRKYEPKDVIRDWGLNFNLGSAVKYISRAGRKKDIVEDLKKAQQFIQFEIDAIEQEHKEPEPEYKRMPFTGGVIYLDSKGNSIPEEIIQMVINELYGGK